MIKTISKITIYVSDVQAAKKFWVEKMGFVVRLEQPMGSDMVWLEVAPSMEAETTFVLYARSLMESQNKEVSTTHPSIILSCENLKELHGKLKGQGVDISDVQVLPYGSMCNFYDQDKQNYMVRED